MKVVVDTSIWSLALRRRTRDLSPFERALVAECAELVREGRVLLPGAVRQELLSGIATAAAFETLRDRLRAFPDVPIDAEDHEDAARCFNACRARGISGSAVDMLLCAIARRSDASVFTTDGDFTRYATPLGLRLHEAVERR